LYLAASESHEKSKLQNSIKDFEIIIVFLKNVIECLGFLLLETLACIYRTPLWLDWRLDDSWSSSWRKRQFMRRFLYDFNDFWRYEYSGSCLSAILVRFSSLIFQFTIFIRFSHVWLNPSFQLCTYHYISCNQSLDLVLDLW